MKDVVKATCFLAALAALAAAGPAAAPAAAQQGAHALVNAVVVLDPGRTIANGRVIVRDGIIEDAGEDVPIPPDARVWDLKGKVVSPAWIDLFASPSRLAKEQGKDGPPKAGPAPPPAACERQGREGMLAGLPSVHPDLDPLEGLSRDPEALAALRGQGFAAALVAPESGVFMGWAGLVDLSDGPLPEAVLQPRAAQVLSLESAVVEDCYPGSIMAAMALVRQMFLDAEWQAGSREGFRKGSKGPRPPYFPALQTLQDFRERSGLFLFRADSVLDVIRGAALAQELHARFCLVGTGQEYVRLKEIARAGLPVVVPIAFPTLPECKTEEDFLDLGLAELRLWDRAPSNAAWLEKAGVDFALTARGLKDTGDFRPMLGIALKRGLTREAALKALTATPARILGVEDRLGSIGPGKLANLIVSAGDPLLPESKIEAVWVNGRCFEQADKGEGKKDEEKGKPGHKRNGKGAGPREQGSAAALGSEPPIDGRGPLLSPERVLVTGGTVWTMGPAGRIEEGDLLVERGRIARVGKGLEAGEGTVVVDARGRHVTPGVIDGHSHAFVCGEINESAFSSSAEVRVADVIDSESRTIELLLSGGNTMANLLHGSANPIGGHSALVKLRLGEEPQGLLFAEARPGIKFALGENVKQSNWGDKYSKRYPQTRMGVIEFIRERFTAAREYARRLGEEARGAETGRPVQRVRRSLELDALAEVLEGKRLIHCHAYRADEMLALMRVAEEFGIRIRTFEHSAEAYKIAREIRRHGAGVSCFSDWWAFKFEVYDAIPYNMALLWEGGVLTAFGSDSAEVARRLNLEAAKTVKYGGVPEEDALKLITINEAAQLGVEARVGSLEPGKDADFAIWSSHPLSYESRCDQTWIEGRKYFDREEADRQWKAREAERNALAAAARAAQSPEAGTPSPKGGAR